MIHDEKKIQSKQPKETQMTDFLKQLVDKEV